MVGSSARGAAGSAAALGADACKHDLFEPAGIGRRTTNRHVARRPSDCVRGGGASRTAQVVGSGAGSPTAWRWGFFALGKLKTIEIAGGAPQTLSDAPLDSRGGAWGPDGTIVFSPTSNGVLYRIAEKRRAATPLTKFDSARAENSHRFPSFLPDGRRFPVHDAKRAVGILGRLDRIPGLSGRDTADRAHRLERSVGPARLRPVPASRNLDGADFNRMVLTAEAVPVANGVGATSTAYAAFSASQTGVLAHAKQIDLSGELRWFDRIRQSARIRVLDVLDRLASLATRRAWEGVRTVRNPLVVHRPERYEHSHIERHCVRSATRWT